MLYTFFLGGKQIAAYWNSERSTAFRTLLDPGENIRVEVTLDNIPEGIHNLYVGYIRHPDRIYWLDIEDSHFRTSTFIINLVATVQHGDATHQIQEDFPHLHEKTDILSEEEFHPSGSFSLSPEHVSLEPSFGIRERDTLYFHYANSHSIPQNVRVCLLRDWIQIPWPSSEEAFLDTVLKPHERLVEKIDLNKIIQEGPMQIAAICFINPHSPRYIIDENRRIQDKTTVTEYFYQSKRVIVLK